jgi:hypothetical protein
MITEHENKMLAKAQSEAEATARTAAKAQAAYDRADREWREAVLQQRQIEFELRSLPIAVAFDGSGEFVRDPAKAAQLATELRRRKAEVERLHAAREKAGKASAEASAKARDAQRRATTIRLAVR